MNASERIAGLLFRHVRGELTAEEERELVAWRGMSTENERLFQEKTDPTHILQELGRRFEKDDQLSREIEKYYSENSEDRNANKRSRIFYLTRIAAAAVIILGLSLYFLLNGHQKTDQQFKATLIDPEGIATALDDMSRGFQAGWSGIKIDREANGELVLVATSDTGAGMDKRFELKTSVEGRFNLRLPDGTRAWLNKGSTIRYPENFSADTIQLDIRGEAYFEIAENAKSYYKIKADSMMIGTAGAQMNIKAYPDSQIISATLLKGTAIIQVNIVLPEESTIYKTPHEFSLLPGQQASFNEMGGFSIRKDVNVKDIISWKNHSDNTK